MSISKLEKIVFILVGILIGVIIVFCVVMFSNNDEVKYDTKVEEKYDDPVGYYESVSNSSDENTLKQGFVNVVDFLFYDKEFKGYKFSELKDDAKLKIINFALKIDNKINEYFPGYKETLKDKYNNFKSKVIKLWIEITTKICSNNEQLCSDAKKDFATMKEYFGITFDFIEKNVEIGKEKLKDWYESFRGDLYDN